MESTVTWEHKSSAIKKSVGAKIPLGLSKRRLKLTGHVSLWDINEMVGSEDAQL